MSTWKIMQSILWMIMIKIRLLINDCTTNYYKMICLKYHEKYL